MGQYHKLVNLDKKEYVSPSGLGLGSKQYEHTGYEGSLSDSMYLLVMSSPNRGGGDFPLTDVSGRWCGDRVVVVGDYTEDGDIPNYEGSDKTLYSDTNDWEDITPEVRNAFTAIFDVQYESKMMSGYEMWNVKGVM